jgi:hypothetical protein
LLSSNTPRTIETLQHIDSESVIKVDDRLGSGNAFKYLIELSDFSIEGDTKEFRKLIFNLTGFEINCQLDYWHIFSTIECYKEEEIELNLSQKVLAQLCSIVYEYLDHVCSDDQYIELVCKPILELMEEVKQSGYNYAILCTHDLNLIPLNVKLNKYIKLFGFLENIEIRN